VGGLSDFHYRVTFTSVHTGQQLVFDKPPWAYVGFADNGTLRFGRPGAEGTRGGLGVSWEEAVSATSLPVGLLLLEEAPTWSMNARRSVRPVPLVAPQSLALSQGRVQVVVEWRNQYSGQSGIAYGLPQEDRFGFFYFADPGNPEVFVKVLDFGQGGALCFVGGLSDLYYKVTFTTLRTGQALIFEKPAGLYLGFADNGLLRF